VAEPRDAGTVLKLFIGDLVLQFAAVQAEVERVTAERDLANAALEGWGKKGTGDGGSDDAAE